MPKHAKKAMELNPDRKSGVDPQGSLAVNTDNLAAIPAAKLFQNMSCIRLDHVGTAEWKAMWSERRMTSPSIAQAYALNFDKTGH